jgi:hypothetical protein
VNYRAIYSKHRREASSGPHPGCAEAFISYGRSGDVGNRAVGERQAEWPAANTAGSYDGIRYLVES